MNLLRVFGRLRDYNVKLKPEKCEFGATEVKFLGFIVNGGGVRTDPDKIRKLI